MAFLGTNSTGQDGIYTDTGGTLAVVADESTAIPGGTGSFVGFGSPSIDGGKVAFVGLAAAASRGIYVDVDGTLLKVVADGDPLDGKIVGTLDYTTEGSSGNQVAFHAGFTDGTEGVFVATLPDPPPVPSLSLLGLAVLGAGLLGVGLSRTRA